MLKGAKSVCAIVGALGFLIAGCGGPRVVESWKNPKAGPMEFKKVVVFFLNKDQTVRGKGEEALAREVKRTAAVPSIGLFQDLDPKHLDAIKGELKNRKFDGAILMRIIFVDEKTSISPGMQPSYYSSFRGYYLYAWPLAYNPGYPEKIEKDRTVKVETVLYSLADDNLIWVGTSETTNPESIRELVTENAGVVARSLADSGLIK